MLQLTVIKTSTEVLTAHCDVYSNAYVHIEVLWLDSKEHGAARLQSLGELVAVVLSVRVEAVVPIHVHLTIALMPFCRGSQEVLLALGTLVKRERGDLIIEGKEIQ